MTMVATTKTADKIQMAIFMIIFMIPKKHELFEGDHLNNEDPDDEAEPDIANS